MVESLLPLALSGSGTAIAVAILGGGALTGIAALRRVGPQRTAQVVGYQGDIIEDINADRERLRKLADELEEKRDELEEQRDELERKYRKVTRENDELRRTCEDLARRVEELERRADLP